ncbi:class I SAM-dependent methyltransferase [Gimesia aquarii]|uniref:16S ribosomal RNA methyltransferase KsgA/Dim1 family protein n=1 Tax=Gimesia aquarii TaxID=2527964 RepID=A0A517VWU2_9PLAN|nr:methyltransferase domain-containing protein [Gimesia aquarii]QDT97477.1 16S ribosomal RNA methyltransferase KsgA/Dim1 family protein [Gimesia aquarii]
MSHYREFFKQFRTTFETTGAIAPSSRFLGSNMAGPMSQHQGPKKVLEIGPGTGAVTRQIVKQIQAGDQLDLVELNDKFVEILNQRFDSEVAFQEIKHLTSIHNCPLQEYGSGEEYDFIISGLPLNNFPTTLVDEIFEAYFRLLKPGGVLSYFEYMYVRPVRKVVSRGEENQRIRNIDEIMGNYTRQFRIRTNWVWFNLPPAWVQHLQKEKGSASLVEQTASQGLEP